MQKVTFPWYSIGDSWILRTEAGVYFCSLIKNSPFLSQIGRVSVITEDVPRVSGLGGWDGYGNMDAAKLACERNYRNRLEVIISEAKSMGFKVS